MLLIYAPNAVVYKQSMAGDGDPGRAKIAHHDLVIPMVLGVDVGGYKVQQACRD